jgi:hypothetical protein
MHFPVFNSEGVSEVLAVLAKSGLSNPGLLIDIEVYIVMCI